MFSTYNFNTLPSTPPNNIDAEESILGGILLDQNALPRIIDYLPPEAFYIGAHKDIYQACCRLFEQGLPVNVLSVSSWLEDNDLSKRTGGRSKLAYLADITVSAVNIDALASLVVEKYTRRKLIKTAYETALNAHRIDTPINTVLEEAENRVTNITNIRKQQGSFYWQQQDAIEFEKLCEDIEQVEAIENTAQRDWVFRKLAKKWKFSNKKDLLDFHAKWLDSQQKTTVFTAREYFERHGANDQGWIFPGLVPTKSVVVMYGGAGTGKTRTMFSMAKLAAVGGTFTYDGTEVDPMNTLLIETDQGARNTSKLLEMQDFISGEASNRTFICDEWTVGEFGRLKKMLETFKPKLVFIDSLMSISTTSIYSENDTEYARPIVRLRHLAQQYDCTFVVLHHTNANGDMRGSRAIKASSDEVWKLERKQTEIDEFNTLTIEKSRSRGPGTYKFTYNEDNWGWIFGGKLDPSSMFGNHTEVDRLLTKIVRFLRENEGTPYECHEVGEHLNIAIATARKELNRAASEGIVNVGKSRRNTRANVYYFGTRKYVNVYNPTKDPSDPSSGSLGSLGDMMKHGDITTEKSALQPLTEAKIVTIPTKDPSDPSDPANFCASHSKSKNASKSLDHLDHFELKPLENKESSNKPKNDSPDHLSHSLTFEVGLSVTSLDGQTGKVVPGELPEKYKNEHRVPVKWDTGTLTYPKTSYLIPQPPEAKANIFIHPSFDQNKTKTFKVHGITGKWIVKYRFEGEHIHLDYTSPESRPAQDTIEINHRTTLGAVRNNVTATVYATEMGLLKDKTFSVRVMGYDDYKTITGCKLIATPEWPSNTWFIFQAPGERKIHVAGIEEFWVE